MALSSPNRRADDEAPTLSLTCLSNTPTKRGMVVRGAAACRLRRRRVLLCWCLGRQGDFTMYLRESIRKNIDLKQTGHA
jgi:hypothetical protein